MGSYGPKLSSCGQRRLRLDSADAQADLSLRWAHSHFVGFDAQADLSLRWDHSHFVGLDAQADLSLRWAHSHFVGFVMRWLISGLDIQVLTFMSRAKSTEQCFFSFH